MNAILKWMDDPEERELVLKAVAQHKDLVKRLEKAGFRIVRDVGAEAADALVARRSYEVGYMEGENSASADYLVRLDVAKYFAEMLNEAVDGVSSEWLADVWKECSVHTRHQLRWMTKNKLDL